MECLKRYVSRSQPDHGLSSNPLRDSTFMTSSKTRRDFLKAAALGAAASAFPLRAATVASAKQEFCVFTKHLIGLGYEQLADIIADMGFDGIDAPIRPGGHVEPERVEEDLPKLMEALEKRGLRISSMTSGINEVSEAQHTEKVLRAAKAAGVPGYRMNYNKYDLTKPIWPQVEAWKPKFKDLIQLSEEIGIQPLYQNHSGKDYLGAPVWDVYELMREYTPKQWGFAFDFFHATAEGFLSWPLELNLVKDRIGIAYFKNFKYEAKKLKNCSLGEGVVTKDSVTALKKTGYTGPISLHIEYLEGKVGDPANLKAAVEATKRDFAVLREWWS